MDVNKKTFKYEHSFVLNKMNLPCQYVVLSHVPC